MYGFCQTDKGDHPLTERSKIPSRRNLRSRILCIVTSSILWNIDQYCEVFLLWQTMTHSVILNYRPYNQLQFSSHNSWYSQNNIGIKHDYILRASQRPKYRTINPQFSEEFDLWKLLRERTSGSQRLVNKSNAVLLITGDVLKPGRIFLIFRLSGRLNKISKT